MDESAQTGWSVVKAWVLAHKWVVVVATVALLGGLVAWALVGGRNAQPNQTATPAVTTPTRQSPSPVASSPAIEASPNASETPVNIGNDVNPEDQQVHDAAPAQPAEPDPVQYQPEPQPVQYEPQPQAYQPPAQYQQPEPYQAPAPVYQPPVEPQPAQQPVQAPQVQQPPVQAPPVEPVWAPRRDTVVCPEAVGPPFQDAEGRWWRHYSDGVDRPSGQSFQC